MAYYRLKETHPFAKKVDALMAFLEQNKMSISYTGEGLILTSTDSGLECAIKDNDDGQGITDLPATFEYKLTFYKD